MCDDFWGDADWECFHGQHAARVPGPPIVDIENADPIFHTVFDLNDRYQVPGARYLSHRRAPRNAKAARRTGAASTTTKGG